MGGLRHRFFSFAVGWRKGRKLSCLRHPAGSRHARLAQRQNKFEDLRLHCSIGNGVDDAANVSSAFRFRPSENLPEVVQDSFGLKIEPSWAECVWLGDGVKLHRCHTGSQDLSSSPKTGKRFPTEIDRRAQVPLRNRAPFTNVPFRLSKVANL